MVVHGLVAVPLDELVAFGSLQVFPHHFGDEFVEAGSRRPAEFFLKLGQGVGAVGGLQRAGEESF